MVLFFSWLLHSAIALFQSWLYNKNNINSLYAKCGQTPKHKHNHKQMTHIGHFNMKHQETFSQTVLIFSFFLTADNAHLVYLGVLQRRS